MNLHPSLTTLALSHSLSCVNRYKKAIVAKTSANYKPVIDQFSKFCDAEGVAAVATIDQVQRFLATVADAHPSASAYKTTRSALNHLRREQGFAHGGSFYSHFLAWLKMIV